jgi:hypothetical protein
LPLTALFGRLREGTAPDEAEAELVARYGTFGIDDATAPRRLVVSEGLTAPLGPRDYDNLLWFVTLSVTISLIASVSFGLLLFARLAATRSDMLVRVALGASTRDLTRLLACEVVLLAFATTVVATISGSALAQFAISQGGPSGWHVSVDTAPDWRVFLSVGSMTLAVALGVVARLGWSIARVEALGSMMAIAGIGGATIRTADTSARLVMAQSAATAALLLLAALIARAALPSRTFTYGLDVDGAAIAWVDQTGRARDTGTSEARRVLQAASEIPGVGLVALLSSLPGGATWTLGVSPRLNSTGERRTARVHYVSADAFDTIGLAATRGRTFTRNEDELGIPVVVVSHAAAEHFWPGIEPIGRRLWLPSSEEHATEVVVICEVSDVEAVAGDQRGQRDVYLHFSFRRQQGQIALLARAPENRNLADALGTSLQRVLPDVGFLSIRPLKQELYERSAPPPGMARILGVLGLIVFLVAMGGLCGLMSYLAAMRQREIGIRKALGATTAALCRMLTRESSRVIASGVAIGVVGGLGLGSFWVRPGSNFHLIDPVAIATVAGLLYLAGLVGAIAPFVRTMREATVRLKD